MLSLRTMNWILGSPRSTSQASAACISCFQAASAGTVRHSEVVHPAAVTVVADHRRTEQLTVLTDAQHDGRRPVHSPQEVAGGIVPGTREAGLGPQRNGIARIIGPQRCDHHTFLIRTQLTWWSGPFRRIAVARALVGRMFSSRFGPLMRFQMSVASCIASSSLMRPKRTK